MQATERRLALVRLVYGRRNDIAALLLCLAILIYALWAVPTFFQISFHEIAIGSLLLLSAMAFGVWNVLNFRCEQSVWTVPARCLSIFSLCQL